MAIKMKDSDKNRYILMSGKSYINLKNLHSALKSNLSSTQIKEDNPNQNYLKLRKGY